MTVPQFHFPRHPMIILQDCITIICICFTHRIYSRVILHQFTCLILFSKICTLHITCLPYTFSFSFSKRSFRVYMGLRCLGKGITYVLPSTAVLSLVRKHFQDTTPRFVLFWSTLIWYSRERNVLHSMTCCPSQFNPRWYKELLLHFFLPQSTHLQLSQIHFSKRVNYWLAQKRWTLNMTWSWAKHVFTCFFFPYASSPPLVTKKSNFRVSYFYELNFSTTFCKICKFEVFVPPNFLMLYIHIAWEWYSW